MSIEHRTTTVTTDQKAGILRVITQELERRGEIVFAYLFGSFAEGTSFRDIDVAIYVAPTMPATGSAGTLSSTSDDGFRFALRLGSDLERLIRHPVDVLLLNTAPDHMVHRISNGKLMVNRDDDRRTTFITSAWSRYFDIQIKRRAYLRDVAGKGLAPHVPGAMVD